MNSLDNNIVIRFASYLCSKDLVSLALTCRRFGSSHLHDTGLSLMEDTALQKINNSQKEERDALPKQVGQTYIELYSELEQLRATRIFDQLIGNRLSYVNNDKSHIEFVDEGTPDNTAISNHVMRAGRHYATFTQEGEWVIRIGIIRPLKNFDKKGLYAFDPLDVEEFRSERTERWGDHESIQVNYCSLAVGSRDFHNNGRCFWSDWLNSREINYIPSNDWEGNEGFENNDEIGMLLALDAGKLSVYKNGRSLGILKDGLTGEYCWTATLWSHGESVIIKKGIIPV